MRYIIGIDLGTTNTCVAYVDTQNPLMQIQNFRVPQLKSAGYIEEQPTLPSCCYLTSSQEWPAGTLDLPWKKHQDNFVGSFARDQGARVPTKLVQSAKSWLCHAAANRRDRILPFEAADDSQRISPVEASARYLMHVRDAWNHGMAKGDPDCEFEQQEVILTVPASFDEIARTLTVEAAKLAGFAHMTLIEEPQAAFYSWISQHEKIWTAKLPLGSCVLVCDVGGGTTDFSLIEVVESEGKPGFVRMAVGEHLLLGGDNMDVAIAHLIESKLRSEGHGECTPYQWLQLRHQARYAKETLLGDKGPGSYRVLIQGAGSHVVQNTISVELHKDELEKLLLGGFWKKYSWNEALQVRKGSGIRAMGLPFEEEPSITRHIACFLMRSAHPLKGIMQPDYVLFNGGAMKPAAFQEAVVDSLKDWFPEREPRVLESYHLDLAVARGAAYYGKVRRGIGVRIGGGTSRGYYFAVDIKDSSGKPETKALTLLPRGSEEGSSYELSQTFWLQPNTPVAFRLYSSSVRLYDKQGDAVTIDPQEMQLLPPIHTVLRFGKGSIADASKDKIPVHLGITLTAIGTLELWLKSQKSDHRWALEFQLRRETGQDNSLAVLDKVRKDETFDAAFLTGARGVINSFYTGDKKNKPSQMMELLEQQLERPRRDWPLSILRGLWEELSAHAGRRKSSPELEARWWNLAGFLLRPGYGFPLDDFRMKELWKAILADQKGERSVECQIQSWICYRRVAGGLNKGQQMQLASDLMAGLNIKKNGAIDLKNKSELYPFQERVRALAAMELIEIPMKIKLGQALIGRMKSGQATAAEFWALGRLGARHLAYGTIGNVIQRDICTQWVESLLDIPESENEQLAFVIGQLARKTELRELNMLGPMLDKVMKRYQGGPNEERLKSLLFEEGRLTEAEQDQVFGDHLPLGISIEK